MHTTWRYRALRFALCYIATTYLTPLIFLPKGDFWMLRLPIGGFSKNFMGCLKYPKEAIAKSVGLTIHVCNAISA